MKLSDEEYLQLEVASFAKGFKACAKTGLTNSRSGFGRSAK